jgi:hypothetical protein
MVSTISPLSHQHRRCRNSWGKASLHGGSVSSQKMSIDANLAYLPDLRKGELLLCLLKLVTEQQEVLRHHHPRKMDQREGRTEAMHVQIIDFAS